MMKRFLLLLLAMLIMAVPGAGVNAAGTVRPGDPALHKGQFAAAADAFRDLGYYLDSTQMAVYCQGLVQASNGGYLMAVSTFESLGDFRDAPLQTLYYAGMYCMSAGGLRGVQRVFQQDFLLPRCCRSARRLRDGPP